jgi:GGDEF domain-containing protein
LALTAHATVLCWLVASVVQMGQGTAELNEAAFTAVYLAILFVPPLYAPLIASPDQQLIQKAEEERVAAEARVEDLKQSFTGLPNKAAYTEATQAALAGTAGGGGAGASSAHLLCVVAIDLAGFKFCNTAMGHSGGDGALTDFSRQFKALADKHSTKGSWGTCQAFHSGGDEYSIICSPPDRRSLVAFVKELAQVEYRGIGTEPGYKGDQIHSWVRAGAVVREAQLMRAKDTDTGKFTCEIEADNLEGQVSSLINLPRGEPAPPLSAKPWLQSRAVEEKKRQGAGHGIGITYGGNYLVWSRPGPVDTDLLPKPGAATLHGTLSVLNPLTAAHSSAAGAVMPGPAAYVAVL